ncbi:MAG: DUF502 domain-containing protein [Candidatus Aminicenantales bacterium]
MNRLFKHLKTRVFRGLLAVVPLYLCFLVVRFLYVSLDRNVSGWIEKIIGRRIPGLGILLVLVILYLLGIVAGNWIGKKIFGFIERVMKRIPLIKSVYQLGIQLGLAFSKPEKQAFKRTVLIEHFRPGLWSIAFVTGELRDPKSGATLLRLFIPTVPNPITGFLVFASEDKVRELPWTIQEAMNAVISGGIITPPEIA